MSSSPTLHIPVIPLPSSPPPRALSGMDLATGSTLPVPPSSGVPKCSTSLATESRPVPAVSHPVPNNRQLPRCNAVYIPTPFDRMTSMPPPSWVPSHCAAETTTSAPRFTSTRPLPAVPKQLPSSSAVYTSMSPAPSHRRIVPKPIVNPKHTLNRPLPRAPKSTVGGRKLPRNDAALISTSPPTKSQPAILEDTARRLIIRDYAFPSSFNLVIPPPAPPAPKPLRSSGRCSSLIPYERPPSSNAPASPEPVEEFEPSAEELAEERKQIANLRLEKERKLAAINRRRKLDTTPSVELAAPRAKRIFDVAALERRLHSPNDGDGTQKTPSPPRKPRLAAGIPLLMNRKLPRTNAMFDGKEVPRIQ